jgi:ribosomal protein S8
VKLSIIREFKEEGYYIVTFNKLKENFKLEEDSYKILITLLKSIKGVSIIKLIKVLKKVL